MNKALISLDSVRMALKASCIEIYEFHLDGKKRRCALVGRYMQQYSIPTVTIAQSRSPYFVRLKQMAQDFSLPQVLRRA